MSCPSHIAFGMKIVPTIDIILVNVQGPLHIFKVILNQNRLTEGGVYLVYPCYGPP